MPIFFSILPVFLFLLGSNPFVPPAKGLDTAVKGLFVYRNIEDLEEIIDQLDQLDAASKQETAEPQKL